MAEDSTGELLVERRLDHESGEAQVFYRSLPKPVRVASKPPARFTGSSACSQNSVTISGSETREDPC